MPSLRRRVSLLLVIGAALSLSACRADASVSVDVRPDGAGTVTVTVALDREATERIGDPLVAVRTSDLTEAGWSIKRPAVKDGAVTYRGVRRFSSPEELATVLDEVGGTGGVFNSTSLAVDNGIGSTHYKFATDVKLTGSLEQFSDAAATKVLGGLPLGRLPAELNVEGANNPDAATLNLVVRLPADSGTTTSKWRRSAASGRPTAVTARAESTVHTWWVISVAGVGAGLLLAGVVVGLLSRRVRPES
jgi:hypothetical protein